MRARLGIDGNCGFALIGNNLQESESEFEEFEGDIKTSDGVRNARLAINRAFTRLKKRVGNISYFLDESHPDYA